MKKFALLSCLLAVAPVALADAPAPASLVRAGVTEKITDHVWAIPDGSASLVPNVGIVVGSKTVLVIDTGMGTRNAGTVLREVAKAGAGKPVYLVTTHVNPEHDMGAHAFPEDSKLIRSKDQGYRAYLTRIRARTAQLKQAGKTLEETLKIVSDEMSAEYPDQFRLSSAIRAGYGEA